MSQKGREPGDRFPPVPLSQAVPDTPLQLLAVVFLDRTDAGFQCLFMGLASLRKLTMTATHRYRALQHQCVIAAHAFIMTTIFDYRRVAATNRREPGNQNIQAKI